MPLGEQTSVRRFSYGRSGAAAATRWTPRRPPQFTVGRRYGLFVAVMKVALPALAVALILVLVVWPQLNPGREGFAIDLSDLSVGQPETLTVLNARFSGLDEKNQPFLVTADVASQAPDDENLITMELPKADITLEDGAWMALTAREGRYDRESEVLDLIGQVDFFHDRGYELHTEAVQMDLQTGTAIGRKPVTGHGFFGEVQAEGFDLFERGDRIIFTGMSRLLILPQAQVDLPTEFGQ